MSVHEGCGGKEEKEKLLPYFTTALKVVTKAIHFNFLAIASNEL
jgi:hypothetical protein